MKSPEDIIPPQVEGSKKDFAYERACASADEAKALFEASRNKLLDINNWHNEGSMAVFMLTDNYGIEQRHKMAHEGLYIKIDIPGPGTQTGDSNDWVHIEKVITGKTIEEQEFTAIKVRPVTNPTHVDGSVAHFFSHKATSTFILKRTDNKVSIHYAGRNEVVNTNADTTLDTIRNVVVGVSARLGFSNLQWERLIKGIIGLH